MEMPKPTDAHKKLELLAGEWSGPEVCHPSPWTPERKEATGHFSNVTALGGFHLIGNYEQVQDGAVVYRGHSVYSYDPDSGEYLCHWFDAMCSNAQAFRGTWEDDVLTFRFHDKQWGHSKMVMDLSQVGDGRYTFRMESSTDGAQWCLCLEGSYERVKVTAD